MSPFKSHKNSIALLVAISAAVSVTASAPADAASAGFAACAVKTGAKAGQLRLLTGAKKCKSTERSITLTATTQTPQTQTAGLPGPTGSAGPTGPAGPAGPVGPVGPVGPAGPKGDPGTAAAKGDTGAKGATGPIGLTGVAGVTGAAGVTGSTGVTGPAGSPDTPQQILSKIETVDGNGSWLDASLLDGIDSTGFLPVGGKAADANLFDGVNSTGFAHRSVASGAAISLGAFGAGVCADFPIGTGGVKAGDFVIVVPSGGSWPAGLVVTSMEASVNSTNVRFCNASNATTPADSNIPIRWIAIN